ncbi:MAG: Hsp20/alpha crystallin family protein [Bacteriovoracaceae bacterium]
MSLINLKKNPVKTMSDREKFFNYFFSPFDSALSDSALEKRFSAEMREFNPNVDVEETDTAYLVKAELPGLKENEVEVKLDENILTIRGEKKSEREEKSKNGSLYKECSYGEFSRSIQFGKEVNSENVTAQLKNGILRVTLEKNQQSQKKARSISIQKD